MTPETTDVFVGIGTFLELQRSRGRMTPETAPSVSMRTSVTTLQRSRAG